MTKQLTPYTNYQLSAIGVGVIATGLSDIRQCIDFILRTIPGSDPLRPLFGCNIYKYLDKPVTSGIPNMKKAIYDALEIWESRIRVTTITHDIETANVLFNITYQVTDSDLLDTLAWSVNGTSQNSTNPNGIILSALVPAKITNGRYNIALVLNGTGANPKTPITGFDTAAEMLTWLNINWSAYGNWFLALDKIVLYLNNNLNVTTASLSISQTAVLTKTAIIPVLSPGEFFEVDFEIGGDDPSPAFPSNISSVEQLINWLNANWSEYGSWYIVNNGNVMTGGDFNEDFNEDFSTTGILIERQLVFQTNIFETAELAFV